MKFRVFSILLFSFGLSTLAMGQDAVADQYMKFEITHIDLGKIEKGTKVPLEFSFTNISEENLEIDMVSVCECSEADWPWKAIKPGESGVIKVIFDSSQKDKEEVITLDVNLINEDPKTGAPIFKTLEYIYSYSF